MKNLAICGDSFNIGIGCEDLRNEPYGSLLAKKYGANLFNFAKGSSSNFGIFLQIKYAIENVKDLDFVCVSVTSYDRTEWFPDDFETQHNMELKNSDVNYHEYPPYHIDSYPTILDNPMKNDPNYTGKMLTESYSSIFHYLDNMSMRYYTRLSGERIDKVKLIKDYYLNVFDVSIKRQYDIGLIVMSHLLLAKNNIPHLIIHSDNDFPQFVPEKNLLFLHWGDLCAKFPDKIGSYHTSPEGHMEIYDMIIKKLENDTNE